MGHLPKLRPGGRRTATGGDPDRVGPLSTTGKRNRAQRAHNNTDVLVFVQGPTPGRIREASDAGIDSLQFMGRRRDARMDKKSFKKMTAAQKKAQARFKAAVSEAKKLRKKNPKLSQPEALKQAFAIEYKKERSGKRIAGPAKKAAKKAAPKKAAKKCAPKKTSRKAAMPGERHTDTKSHNVNIRVMSGIHDELYQRRDEIETGLKRIEHTLHELKERLKKADTAIMKQRIKQGIAIHAAIQKNMKAELRKIHNVLSK